ncbi:MAG: transporter [Gammaproteobacteria bacterium]|jgi:ABC-type polysaccharide/polyol phosphate transport system ATPase subunit|nr:transporter [Gammaproteobacteria bacterium]
MTSISVKNLSLRYIKHINRPNSLKESVIKYILNFGKPYYSSEDFLALDNISFELKQGDRLGIIGINGAGKSSLLKVITNIYPPSQGSVKVNGRISSLIEIGAGFDPELTGRENIYLNGLISGFSKKEISAKLNEIIEFSGLAEFIDTPIKYYSTGMGLRLGLSIATCINPEILICDELFAGGDLNFIEKATNRLNQIIDQAHIFITVSHDNGYIREFCNKVLYLKDHKVAYFGSDVEKGLNQYIQDNHTKQTD